MTQYTCMYINTYVFIIPPTIQTIQGEIVILLNELFRDESSHIKCVYLSREKRLLREILIVLLLIIGYQL